MTIDIERVSAIIRDVSASEVMSRWQKLAPGDIEHKSHVGDIVTVADRAAEAALARQLTALLPGSLVIGEEGVSANPALLDQFQSNAPIWVLDPIDGTRAYSNGKPHFDMMVALVIAGTPVAGWIYHPVSGDMIAGESGSGAIAETLRGARTRLTPVCPTSIRQMIGLVRQSWPKDDRRRKIVAAAAHFAALQEPRSAGRNYAQLLAGTAHFLMNFTPHPWDHLAGMLLISEAGHVYARLDGAPYHPGRGRAAILTAPSQPLWDEAQALLVGAGDGLEAGK